MRLKLGVLHYNFNQTHILIKSTTTKNDFLILFFYITTTKATTVPNTLYIVVVGKSQFQTSFCLENLSFWDNETKCPCNFDFFSWQSFYKKKKLIQSLYLFLHRIHVIWLLTLKYIFYALNYIKIDNI